MADRELDVWLYDRRAGVLTSGADGLAYRYEPEWVEDEMPPLSQSLPVVPGSHEGGAVEAFFANLLPEGEVRRHVARRLGVSVGNDFGLLAALGGGCAGAVSLTARDDRPAPYLDAPTRWLSEAELAEAVLVAAALRAGGAVTHGTHCLA